jgi:hypothetical protein
MTGKLNPDRSNHTNRIVSYATMHHTQNEKEGSLLNFCQM